MNHKGIIKDFHKLKEPLLIYGNPGCGKSYLAKDLLKNTILLQIDTNSLKGIRDSKEYILDKLKRKNITLMFHQETKQRGLLLDDIHVFYKYDKILYKSIIEFIKEGKFYNSKIILTCCTTFLKNKALCKLKISRYRINYDKSSYYKICLKILKDKNIRLSSDKCDQIIYYSDYNFNKFNNELNMLFNNSESILITNYDNFDPIEKITENLLKKKYSFNEILRLCENDEIIIGFNLLENCLSFLNNYEKTLYKIYEFFTISDIMETYNIKNHDGLIKNYSIGISIYVINKFIHEYYKENNSSIYYNKYISKSMANVISLNNYKNNKIYYSNLLLYLFYVYNELKTDKYKNIILKFYNEYPKEITNITNKFNYFYNYKFNLKMLYQ